MPSTSTGKLDDTTRRCSRVPCANFPSHFIRIKLSRPQASRPQGTWSVFIFKILMIELPLNGRGYHVITIGSSRTRGTCWHTMLIDVRCVDLSGAGILHLCTVYLDDLATQVDNAERRELVVSGTRKNTCKLHPSIFSCLVIQPRTAHFVCARRCLCMHSGQDVQMYDVCMIYRLLHNVQATVQFVFSFAECV